MGTKDITWNEDYWGKAQTKALQGICAVIVMLHHMAQKTCAGWLPDEYFVPGLQPFLSLGYLMVAVFFFCSGFGLYKSVKAKENYLDGFIGKHFRPIILIFIITNACYFLVGDTYSGYNWYIYAILYLYVAFYISFRYIRKENLSIAALIGFVALYVAICEAVAVGSWCYNTVGVFAVGLLFAKLDGQITQFIRRKYWECLAATFILTAAAFSGAELLNDMAAGTENMKVFTLVRVGAVAVQFISATSFAVLMFIAGQKIRLRSRVLEFAGSLSLELYMIHVLYVEMFGWCFAYAENGAVCYIRSLWLYVPVVLVLSFVSAYALSWVKKGAEYIYGKYPEIFAAIRKDAKKFLKGLLIAVAAVTVILTISGLTKSAEQRKKAEKYRDENITFVRVEDTDIALYTAGEGDETVMILSGNYDPCPALTQKGLADELAKDCRVVVVDLPGTGFSGDYKSERTAENICRELHGVAEKLGLDGFTILGQDITCIYALYYVNKYPGEVKRVANLDAQTAQLGRVRLASENLSACEYARQQKAAATGSYLLGRAINIFGVKNLLWPVYEEMYMNSVGWQNYDVVRHVLFKNYESLAIRDERINEINNYLAVEFLTYPDDVEVIDFVSEGKRIAYEKRGIIINEYLNAMCPDTAEHRIVPVTDCTYCVLFNPETISGHIK